MFDISLPFFVDALEAVAVGVPSFIDLLPAVSTVDAPIAAAVVDDGTDSSALAEGAAVACDGLPAVSLLRAPSDFRGGMVLFMCARACVYRVYCVEEDPWLREDKIGEPVCFLAQRIWPSSNYLMDAFVPLKPQRRLFLELLSC